MSPAETIAYVNAQAACAMIEALGMKAENEQRKVQGNSPAYGEAAFSAIIDKYCISHNAVMQLFQESNYYV